MVGQVFAGCLTVSAHRQHIALPVVKLMLCTKNTRGVCLLYMAPHRRESSHYFSEKIHGINMPFWKFGVLSFASGITASFPYYLSKWFPTLMYLVLVSSSSFPSFDDSVVRALKMTSTAPHMISPKSQSAAMSWIRKKSYARLSF